jgi:hypothetical protein
MERRLGRRQGEREAKDRPTRARGLSRARSFRDRGGRRFNRRHAPMTGPTGEKARTTRLGKGGMAGNLVALALERSHRFPRRGAIPNEPPMATLLLTKPVPRRSSPRKRSLKSEANAFIRYLGPRFAWPRGDRGVGSPATLVRARIRAESPSSARRVAASVPVPRGRSSR